MAQKWVPSEATRRGAQRVWLDLVAARVVTAMRDRGLRPILLKGPPIARWLYADDPAARGYVDVDLIVARDQLDAAETVLRALGFERRTVLLRDDPEPHAEPFVRSDGATVDLHRTLHRCERISNELVWSCVSTDTEIMVVGGVEVEVPSVPVRLLHVAMHLDPLKHGPGDRAFVDLARAVERVDLEDWQRARAVAQRLGAADAMGFGVRLVPGGEALAEQLELPATAPESALLRAATPSAQFVARLAALGGFRAKARYVWQKLVPPRAYMEQSTALARRGRSGLLLAYLRRIATAPAHLPGAWRGFQRIRRHHDRAVSSTPSSFNRPRFISRPPP